MKAYRGLVCAALAFAPLASCGGEIIDEGGGNGGSGSGGSTAGSSGQAGNSGYTGTGGGYYGTSGGYYGTGSGTASGTVTSSGTYLPEDAGGFPVDASPIVDAGSPCPGPSWASYCVELIDDLETDTGFLPPMNGRDGPWFTYNDGTAGGMQSPAPYPASTFFPANTTPYFPNPVTGALSDYSAATKGSGFTTWGAGMGFLFLVSDSQGKERPYDASAYQGIVFWGVGNPTQNLRVFLYDANTNYDGGVCGTSSQCDPFGASVTLYAGWTPYTLLFSDLQQESWGTRFPALDPSTLYAMNFQVAAGQTFDFEVDDIYFILK